jgi:hypothetical protein
MANIFRDPKARCAWVYGQEMEPCPKCGSYNLKYQTPIKQSKEIKEAFEDSEFRPEVLVKAWAKATKSGHTELEGPSYLMCWDCWHKGPAVDCTGRTSEEVGQDKAVADEIKRLWNEAARDYEKD